MKGIVAEVKGKQAVVLAQDGTFQKVKAFSGMTVGSEIDLSRPNSSAKVVRLATRISSIAAAALFAVGIGYGAYCYTLPYTYVDMDINPSVELTANVYDRIIKVEAFNEEGKQLILEHKWNNRKLDNGITQLLSGAVEHGYLKAASGKADPVTSSSAIGQDGTGEGKGQNSQGSSISDFGSVPGNAVLVTVSSNNMSKSIEIRKKIVKMASEELAKSNVESDVLGGEASIQQKEDARMLGMTPGKLALIEDAMEGQPEQKMEELKKSAVKELVKKIRERKAAEKAAAKAAEKAASKVDDPKIGAPENRNPAVNSSNPSDGRPDGTRKDDASSGKEQKENDKKDNRAGQGIVGQIRDIGNGNTRKDDSGSAVNGSAVTAGKNGKTVETGKKNSSQATGQGNGQKGSAEGLRDNDKNKAEQERKKLQKQKLRDELIQQIQEQQKTEEQKKLQEQRKELQEQQKNLQEQQKRSSANESSQGSNSGNTDNKGNKGNQDKVRSEKKGAASQGFASTGDNSGSSGDNPGQEKGQGKKAGK